MKHIIEIGIGPHANRTYLKAIKKWGKSLGIHLSLVVDLKTQESYVSECLNSLDLNPNIYLVDHFENTLPQEVHHFLSQYVKDNHISGVIISSEPSTHFAYANWALEMGLNILMDKPVSTFSNVVNSPYEANKIKSSYQALLSSYEKLQQHQNTIFSINTHRRFHPGFQVVKEKIEETADLTGCPVTSISSSHSDGQWRLPNEIEELEYHGYNKGYGKVSHSGYHFFDLVYKLYHVPSLVEKLADEVEVFSSFVLPTGYLHQLNESDFIKMFGQKYSELNKTSHAELHQNYHSYGEIDASISLKMLKNKTNVCNININLLHNSFSRRDSLYPSKDLYKQNGRVKHEHHTLQQGPFQTIQIHSYQSESDHTQKSKNDFKVGGNNHFDIHIYRNKSFFPKKEVLEILSMDDVINKHQSIEKEDILINESIKDSVFYEFASFLNGEISKEKLHSNITDHIVPVNIMSSVYQSNIQYKKGDNPLVSFPVSFKK